MSLIWPAAKSRLAMSGLADSVLTQYYIGWGVGKQVWEDIMRDGSWRSTHS